MTRPQDHHRRATAEQRRFLEALLFWRALYARRGAQDREPVASVESVMASAQLRLGAPSAA